MKRSKLNSLVDLISFAAFVFLTSTGVLVRYVLPPGSGHFTTLFGLDRHDWGNIHFWVALAFFACLSAHLFLHWKWIVALIKGRKREGSAVRAGLGILGLVTVLALSLAPLLVPTEQTISTRGSGEQHPPGVQFRGSMTLAEVEEITDVPKEYILRELALPANTSTSETLGSIGSRHGFTVQGVRDVVERYKQEN